MSGVIRNVQGYPTSTDYAALWELAQKQSVVCLVRFSKNSVDVAQTLGIHGGEDGVQVHISCRGTGYVQGWNRADFVQQCERAKVKWLVPQEFTPCD